MCDFDLACTHLVAMHDTLLCYSEHLSNLVLKRCVCGKVTEQRKQCDLDLRATRVVVIYGTSPCYIVNLYYVDFKSLYTWQSSSLYMTTIMCSHFRTSLTLKCDLDLKVTILYVLHDTLSCYSDYLCHVYFKSFHVRKINVYQMDHWKVHIMN